MKTLLLDIETAPNLGYAWEFYDTNLIRVKEPWYILCIAHMWLEDEQAKVMTINDRGSSEFKILWDFWKLLDEADIVVAHNGDKFDLRKLNARFIAYNLGPPSPFFSVDTLKAARRYFKFTQNGLDPLAQHLELGEKEKHEGFDLWEACMEGDPKAWRKMKRYARKDVVLLKELYLTLRPWISNHPNVMVKSGGDGCPKCGSLELQRRGLRHTRTMTYQQWHCLSCGGWSRSRIAQPTERPEQV